MYVTFLTRRFYPCIGGVEKHVMEISKELIKKGHVITIITESNDITSAVKDEINGIKIFRISTGTDNWFKKIRIWKEIWKLRKVLQNSDVIHCHDVFFWYLPFRFVFFKPVFTTFHGYESYPIKKGAIISRKIAEKLSWGNICIGDFIKKWYGTKPTYVSYGGTEVIKLMPQVPEGSNVKQQKESALFIGRLDEQTGILTYAKTIEYVKKEYPKFDFSIVGDGKYRKMLDKSLKVFGFKKDPEKYFAQYNFAFVSRYLSILEAFAHQKLVFATYDNPVKEDYLTLAPFAKWIVIEKDPKKLAEKVTYYLNNPAKKKELTDLAFLWVKDQTWAKVTEIYLSLWGRANTF